MDIYYYASLNSVSVREFYTKNILENIHLIWLGQTADASY